MLKNAKLGDNILLVAYFEEKIPVTHVENTFDHLVYYISIVPEQSAAFPQGKDALINFLKKESEPYVAFLDQRNLKPARISFTIHKNGEVGEVKLLDTCGDSAVDVELVNIVQKLPNWNAAKNEKGENVNQEMVFFFGRRGC